MKFRSFFMGLAAVIVFFVIDALVNGCVYLLVLIINRHNTGLSAWIVPFWARGIASFVGAWAGIAANDNIFKSYPRRSVAITIFIFFGICVLLTLFGLFIDDRDWSEREYDLVFILGAAITCLTVWKRLWPTVKNSN